MKRKIITLLIGALAVFAFMPVSVLATCRGIYGTDFECGDVVTESCTLDEDMICGCTPGCCSPGLIIGAHGITINGAGFKLVGNCPLEDCCPVLMDAGGPYSQPCRVSSANGGTIDNGGTGLYSGIYNAVFACEGGGPTWGGCVPPNTGVVGQHGCDNLTVINLEITGYCDGIFTSGTIRDDSDDPSTHDLVEGQEFYHNVIHHNGFGDTVLNSSGEPVPTCPTCLNDAIFTALLGVADSNYPENSQFPINKPGVYTCTVDEGEVEGNTSIISNNNIWSQKGWGIEGGPGGNGINLQGGVEFDIGETNPIRYSSCVEVHNNAIMKVRLSGIMLTHALEDVKMYKNDIEYAEYGGITIPCDFVKFNTIEHNVIIKCAGVGIGVFEGTHIIGNVVKDTVKGMDHFDLGFPNAGDGILVRSGELGKVKNTSDLSDNISCFSYDKDIKVFNGNVINCAHSNGIDGRNQCCKTNAAADSCHKWNCACFAADPDVYDCSNGVWSDWKKAVSGDVNNSGTVTSSDRSVLYDVWQLSFTDKW